MFSDSIGKDGKCYTLTKQRIDNTCASTSMYSEFVSAVVALRLLHLGGDDILGDLLYPITNMVNLGGDNYCRSLLAK